jgi:hypothetical protein
MWYRDMEGRIKWLLLDGACWSLSGCSMEKLYQMRQKQKVNPYEQIDFGSMVKRYMDKDQTSVGTIEGIYSVSSLITKKGKGLLSSTEKGKGGRAQRELLKSGHYP